SAPLTAARADEGWARRAPPGQNERAALPAADRRNGRCGANPGTTSHTPREQSSPPGARPDRLAHIARGPSPWHAPRTHARASGAAQDRQAHAADGPGDARCDRLYTRPARRARWAPARAVLTARAAEATTRLQD